MQEVNSYLKDSFTTVDVPLAADAELEFKKLSFVTVVLKSPDFILLTDDFNKALKAVRYSSKILQSIGTNVTCNNDTQADGLYNMILIFGRGGGLAAQFFR